MTNQEDIVATRFALCDANGNVRAVISTGRDGMPYLNFYADHSAPPRLALSLDPDGTPHVSLFRGNKPAVTIGASKGGAGVSIHDSAGIPRVMIGLHEDEPPIIELLDEKGKTIWATANLSED
jgi:hypothetical protein